MAAGEFYARTIPVGDSQARLASHDAPKVGLRGNVGAVCLNWGILPLPSSQA